MTRDDLLHKPKSGLIDLGLQKSAEREALQRDIDAYLQRGGRIQSIDTGVISNVNPATKKPYNNTVNADIKRL